MRFELKPSFERSLKVLYPKSREQVKNACLKTIDILSQDRFIHKGIGLKRLKGDYWEVRHGLKTRLIFRWNKDLVEFVLAGSHDDIKKYLRRI
jgi:mRNA-degrading endonuclease RelE of RelBE toxin-antitoxin system